MTPAPFDYSMNVLDPVAALQSGMAFGQQQRAGEQAIDMNAQSMDLRGSQEARAQTAFDQQTTQFDQGQQDRTAAMEAARAMNADLAAFADRVETGDYDVNDFAAMSTKYPDLASQLMEGWDGLSLERKTADTASLVKGLTAIKAGRPDLAVSMLEERATAADNSGEKQDADISRALAAAIKGDPASGTVALGMLLQSIDADAAKGLFGEGRSVQSTNAYANGTTVTVFNNGSKEVTDAAGNVLQGPEAQAAVDAGVQSEAAMRGGNAGASEEAKLGARIDLGGEAAASEEAGKQAIAKSGEAFDSLNKAKANIVNVDNAIAAIDGGANAGVIAKYFPNITAASASLENAMNRLGLDVIGSVTFGALSEGEMKLAMETAVPRNLGEADLKQWLVSKKAAQEKAVDALRAAAIYLGTPGNTLAGWMQGQGATAPAAGSNSPPPAFDQSEIDALMAGP